MFITDDFWRHALPRKAQCVPTPTLREREENGGQAGFNIVQDLSWTSKSILKRIKVG